MEPHHETFISNPRTWVGVAFILFFLIFGRKLWAAVTKVLDSRAAGIRNELDEAARLRREAEALLSEAKAQREQAMRDAEVMLARAHEEAVRVADAARADAAAAAKRRETLAMDRITAAEKAAVTDVRLAAADIAARAANKVIAEGFGAEADAALIDRSIQQLPSALSSRRAA